MNTFRDYLKTYIRIEDDDWNLFISKLEWKQYKQGQTILRKGHVENYLSFIISGIMRFYLIEKEEELTFNILCEQELTCAFDSFFCSNLHSFKVRH